MADASEAARQLSRARWGSSRTTKLVDELIARINEVEPEAAAKLRAVLDASRREREAAR